MKATVLISNLKDPLKMANIHANSKYAEPCIFCTYSNSNNFLTTCIETVQARNLIIFFGRTSSWVSKIQDSIIRRIHIILLYICTTSELSLLASPNMVLPAGSALCNQLYAVLIQLYVLRKFVGFYDIIVGRKLSVSSLLAFINGDRLKVEQFFKDTLDHMGPFGMKNDRIEIRNLLIDGQNYYRHEKCSAIFDPFVKLLRIKFDKIQILNISGEFQLNFHDSIAPLKRLLDCRRGKFRIDCRNIDLFLVLKVDQETIKKVDLSFENCDFLVKISDTGLGFLVEKIAAKLIEMNKMNILNNFARLMEKWVLENGLNLSCL